MTNYDTPPAYTGSPMGAGTGVKQTLSLASVITGGVSLVIFTLLGMFAGIGIIGFLGGVAAVVLGHLAKRREPGAPRWMWLTGIITGYATIAINLLVFFVLILFAGLLFAGAAGAGMG